ncbi:MAG: RNA polymerase-binding protein DksA [Rhodanobacter sp.]
MKSARKSSAKPAAKKSSPKSAIRKVPAKAPAKKLAPTKKVVAKKVAAKKAPVKKVPAKKASTERAVAKQVVAKRLSPGKAAVKKTTPGAAKKPASKAPSTKAAAKKVVKPAVSAHTAPQKAVVQPQPVTAANHHSPSPTSRLFKGKVASATAMVTPNGSPAAGLHASSHKKSKSSSAMNKLATKSLDNGITREDGRYALPATSNITLPQGYRPSADEEYMSPQHLAYFRNKLRDWRDQLVEESRQTMDNLRGEVRDVGDEAERATRETENSLELRTRDRYRKLISKIDKALRRIEEGSYGFCEETDEEIGVDRLDARPIATLSLDAQERREHLQKQMGD